MKINEKDNKIVIELSKEEHSDLCSCLSCYYKECFYCPRANTMKKFSHLKKENENEEYSMAGVKYLEYFLSDDLPTIDAVAKRFNKYPSGIVKCIKAVLKKYGGISFGYGQRLETISRKEMKRILNIAKEYEIK